MSDKNSGVKNANVTRMMCMLVAFHTATSTHFGLENYPSKRIVRLMLFRLRTNLVM